MISFNNIEPIYFVEASQTQINICKALLIMADNSTIKLNKQKDNTWTFCNDYKAVNALNKSIHTLLPRIDS